ncbi:MAG: universal stress protein [Dehalococcoidia bacterium]
MGHQNHSITAKRILVPVKGEPVDEEALHLAFELAKENKAQIFVLYVIEMPWEFPVDAEVAQETSRGEEVLQRFEALAEDGKHAIEAEILQAREMGTAVVQEAVDRSVDVVVIGLPYQKRYGSFTLGAAVPYILRYAPCPVIVWRDRLTNGQPSTGQE